MLICKMETAVFAAVLAQAFSKTRVQSTGQIVDSQVIAPAAFLGANLFLIVVGEGKDGRPL